MQFEEWHSLLKETFTPIELKFPRIQLETTKAAEFIEELARYILKTVVDEKLTDKSAIEIVIPKIVEDLSRCVLDNPSRYNNFLKKIKASIDKKIKFLALEMLLPSKIIVNDSQYMRRMVSLARLLTPSRSVTACIGIAFWEKRFLVAVNTPRPRVKQDECQKILEGKWKQIAEFLQTITQTPYSANKLDSLANETISTLKEMGGLSLFSNKRYTTSEERLKVDLLKIAAFYKHGLASEGQQGFSKNDCQAIMAEPSIYFPDAKETKKSPYSLHADQTIFSVIWFLSTDKNDKPVNSEPIRIAMPKLACQACAAVLGDYPDIVTYHGNADLGFDNSMDARTSEKYNYIPKRSSRNGLFADDSESEPEWDNDTSIAINNSIVVNTSSFFQLPNNPQKVEDYTPGLLSIKTFC